MIYYDPTGHFNIFSGSDWKGLANNAKEVTIGVADGTMRFVSGGTYQTVGNFANDVQWAYNNNEYLASGTSSYIFETASSIKQNVVNAGNDIRWAYNNRDLVAETVNENVQQFKADVKWAMDNRSIVAEATNEMATQAINDFNSKSLREKTAIITDATLNVASFIGVPETAATKLTQLTKVDKLADAMNLIDKLYDAGTGMKRLDNALDATKVMSHLTGKSTKTRNRAIDAVIEEDFSSLNLSHKPVYNKFSSSGVTRPGEGIQFGRNSFMNCSTLRDTLIHEELHNR